MSDLPEPGSTAQDEPQDDTIEATAEPATESAAADIESTASIPDEDDAAFEAAHDDPSAAQAVDGTGQTAALPLAETPQGQVERILEALLLASEVPLSLEQLHRLIGADLGLGRKELRECLERLAVSLEGRAGELREVASGWRIQVRADYGQWVARLYQEKPPRLSRALLETLALVCYRQPITRGEIEEVRGVALSPNIVRTLLDRGWIREVGVKEVPGRPSLFGTTQQLLDDLNLRSLDQLPALPEIKDPQQLEAALARLGEQLHETAPVTEADEAPPREAMPDDVASDTVPESEPEASPVSGSDDIGEAVEPAADAGEQDDAEDQPPEPGDDPR